MINLFKKIFLLETCKLIVIKKRLKLIIICLTLLSTIAIFKVSLESYENNDNESEYKIVILGDEQRTSYITVVTTLFLFGRSKHSKNQYGAWSNTMLKSLGAPIVAFIDFNWEQKFIERCRENNITGIVYITKSIWNILRELERLRKTEYIESYKTKQLKMDAQKRMHSPELYAVWNLKTYLVNKVAQKNPFKSEFFIFTDSGAWRERKFSNWPNEDIVRNVSRKLQNRILYAQIYNPKKKDFSIRSNIIEGGFFAGTSLAISTAFDNFYSLHDEWLAKGMFIGKDQDIMNQLAFIQAKSSIARLRTFGLTCNVSYNRWFFYQYYFSQHTEYPCRDYRLALLMF